jgi:hypothetical protein
MFHIRNQLLPICKDLNNYVKYTVIPEIDAEISRVHAISNEDEIPPHLYTFTTAL